MGRAQPLPRTDRGFRNEVYHREHLVRVRVHKRLHPCSRTLILNLYNVRESSGAVRLYQELKRCGVSIVGTIQCLLCCSDRIAERYSRSMVRRASFIKSTQSTTPRGRPNIRADLQGLTKEEPNDKTLPSSLKAMLATALATGTPSCHMFRKSSRLRKRKESTHDLLLQEGVLRHFCLRARTELNIVLMNTQLRRKEGHRGGFDVEVACTTCEGVIQSLNTESLLSMSADRTVTIRRGRSRPGKLTRGGTSQA